MLNLVVCILTAELQRVKHRYKFTFMFPWQGWELSPDATDCAIACVKIGSGAGVCGLSVDAARVSS
jgi:putative methionine-R-sulfoxide reductase with GAF domain